MNVNTLERNIDVVASLYAALARHDAPTLFAATDPQVVISQAEELPWGGTYRGLDGLREFLTKLGQTIESKVEGTECFAAGDHVVGIGRSVGRVRKNGAHFDVRVAHIWTLRQGKVVRFEPYIDTPAMLAALNAVPIEAAILSS